MRNRFSSMVLALAVCILAWLLPAAADPQAPECPHEVTYTVAENNTATCTEPGTCDLVTYCSGCNAELSRETGAYAEPKGHESGSLTRVVDREATCTVPGAYHMAAFCTVCHAEVERDEEVPIEAPGHSAGAPARENEKAAACTEPGGYDLVTRCTVCTAILESEHVALTALGHDWDEGAVTTAATCAQEGVRTFTCRRDGSHTYTEAIAKTAHAPGAAAHENETPATCTEAGSYDEVVRCTACRAELERRGPIAVEALGHTPGEAVRENEKAATCVRNGTCDEVVRCAVCGVELSRKTVITQKATGAHIPGDPVVETLVPVTCTKDGTQALRTYCRTCGGLLSEEEEVVPAGGHSWSDWNDSAMSAFIARVYRFFNVRVPSPCLVDTIQTRACSACGLRESRTLPAPGHSWTEWITLQAATCEEKGRLRRTCLRCGTGQIKSVEPIGHEWSDWEVVSKPTYGKDGLMERRCAHDQSHVETKAIPATTPMKVHLYDQRYADLVEIIRFDKSHTDGEPIFRFAGFDLASASEEELYELSHRDDIMAAVLAAASGKNKEVETFALEGGGSITFDAARIGGLVGEMRSRVNYKKEEKNDLSLEELLAAILGYNSGYGSSNSGSGFQITLVFQQEEQKVEFEQYNDYEPEIVEFNDPDD